MKRSPRDIDKHLPNLIVVDDIDSAITPEQQAKGEVYLTRINALSEALKKIGESGVVVLPPGQKIKIIT